jgi:hypothetical protein
MGRQKRKIIEEKQSNSIKFRKSLGQALNQSEASPNDGTKPGWGKDILDLLDSLDCQKEGTSALRSNRDYGKLISNDALLEHRVDKWGQSCLPGEKEQQPEQDKKADHGNEHPKLLLP